MRFVKAADFDHNDFQSYYARIGKGSEETVSSGYFNGDIFVMHLFNEVIKKERWGELEIIDMKSQADEWVSVEKEFPKYEYESRCINRGNSESKTITAMAAQGYRLVAVSPYDIGNQLYFERLIVAPQPPKQ